MDLEEAYDKIYRYVYFRLKDQSAAEDITQETFLRCLSKKGNVREYEMQYLYTIARNLCIDEYRRVKPEALSEDEEVGTTAPFDGLEDKMMVREALAKLPLEDQELLLLRYANNEPIGMICKALQLSRFAVYRRLKSAEERFRGSLEVDEE
ncbi:MAG: sigma-70 family RNA polymerase sigma factor [Lachnospiraceae bacterium]|nr:sigma-70 family RNA polymerase sigma factor [Lachnospiraceae bacterium]